MQLFLFQNQQQVGPYTETQIREMLDCGSIQETDVCWMEGWDDWRPVGALFPSQSKKETAKTPFPTEEKPSGQINKRSIPTWAFVCTAALVALILGYFIGREHVKYEIKTAFSDAAESFSQGITDAFSSNSEVNEPIIKLQLGQIYEVDSFSIILTTAVIDLPLINGGMWSNEPSQAKEPLLILSFDIVNKDERRKLNFRADNLTLVDDVENRIRGSFHESSEGLKKYDEILPGTSVSHVALFEIPLPKTQHMNLTVDLALLGNEGVIEYTIPFGSIKDNR